MQCWWR